MTDSDVVVLDACRTAIGALCGSLADTPASVMGGNLLKRCWKDMIFRRQKLMK